MDAPGEPATRLALGPPSARFWHTGPAVVIGLILFAILGLTLGYAVPGRSAWFALAVPVAFAIITAFVSGPEIRLVLVLLLALAITAAAVLAGRLIDRRLSERGTAA